MSRPNRQDVSNWMDQRRQILPAIVAVSLFFIWMQVAPLLFKDAFRPPKPGQDDQATAAADQQQQEPAGQTPEASADTPSVSAPNAQDKLPDYPQRIITLGEPGFSGGYLLQAQINTTGASVASVALTDSRYTTLSRKEQLKLVGNGIDKNVGKGPDPETFQLGVALIDELLAKYHTSLATVNWEVTRETADSVTLRYPGPDQKFEIIKTFEVPKVDVADRDTSAAGYLMNVRIELRNLSDAPCKTGYSLVGPVGVPLENAENTRQFREVRLGLLENPKRPDRVTSTNLLAADLVKQYNKSRQQGGKPVVDWRTPVAYAGVDDQFFAALVLPQGNQWADENSDGQPDMLVSVTRPLLLHLNTAKPERSDMTIVMDSPELTIPAGQEVAANYQAFFGPKRPAIIQELNAEAIIQLGWFSVVAKFMLGILNSFHNIGLPYAFAIMLLTVCVRLAMLPVSRKQAIEAEKMRILAPKMKEMQEKHKGQPEEFAKAYREFQRKHNYHPMVGCLPALIQLPIFLGLYNSLNHAVDLRLARFLWIDNLAAPDNLFPLGFTVPYFGWTEFNLLPMLTVVLFVAQQKMFMPPPTSDEQAMQYRVMNFMMIAIGFAFYRVPAGLCLYFITSSLWGISERLWLKRSLKTHQQAVAEAGADVNAAGAVVAAPKGGTPPATKLKTPGWWDRVLAAADEARNTTQAQSSQRKYSKDRSRKGSK